MDNLELDSSSGLTCGENEYDGELADSVCEHRSNLIGSVKAPSTTTTSSEISIHTTQDNANVTAMTTVMTEDISNNPITRKVVFVIEGDIEKPIEVELPLDITVGDAKLFLYTFDLGITPEHFKLLKSSKLLSQDDKLFHQVRGDEDCEFTVEFGIDESTLENRPNLETTSWCDEPDLKVIKVITEDEGGDKKYLEVSVFNEAHPKEYCGSFRGKTTGRIFHHAWTQTNLKRLHPNAIPGTQSIKLYTRETQTLLPLLDEGINTVVNKCTQMSNSEIYIPSVSDKIMVCRPFISFDKVNKTMTPFEAVMIIQKAWRTYIARKRIREHYKSLADMKDAKSQFKGTNLQEFRKHQLQLLTKDSNPIGRADFYDLYSALGEWKINEIKKLKEEKSGFAYKAALLDLHKVEIKGLLEIETHRVRARNENLQRQDMMFLEGTSRSRVRRYAKGNVTVIDDLNILKAREFKEMFTSYKRLDVTKSERIEILTLIKSCLAGFEEVDLTLDLIKLLDREIDLITIGIDDNKLAIHRKRFEGLFMDLVKNPEFNPQAKYYKKSSMTTKKYALYRCHGCRKVLDPSQFFIHLRQVRFKLCTSCSYLHTTTTASTNLAPYKRILTSLRAAEQERQCRSAIPFLIQPWGMHFLVNVLWNGKSIISGSSYLPGLRMTRWLPNQEWSMWNTILLTELEAHKHDRLEDPLEVYSKEFVLNVMNRNILGRIHFAAVPNIDDKFKTRVSPGTLPKDYLLHTNRRQGVFLQKNAVHPSLLPNRYKIACDDMQ